MNRDYQHQHTDFRNSVTRGRGPIVLRVLNAYGFHEHGTIQQAKVEAERLAQTLGGEFVVYVPVASVQPAPKTITTDLTQRDEAQPLVENDFGF